MIRLISLMKYLCLMGKTKKVAIKEIWGSFITPKWFLQETNKINSKGLPYTYDFKGLKNSIKENGVLNPLEVEMVWWKLDKEMVYWESSLDKQYKYRILDGNHRAYCLLDMYGEDYEAEVKVTWNSRIESS